MLYSRQTVVCGRQLALIKSKASGECSLTPRTMSSYLARLSDPKLFVSKETLDCACRLHCIPCLYKLAPEGLQDYVSEHAKSADHEGGGCNGGSNGAGSSRVPPNVRPELCARLRSSYGGVRVSTTGQHNRLLPYDGQQNILLLGDGDFSFALALCNGLDRATSSSSSSSAKRGAVYATSHESHASLLATYPNIKSTLQALLDKDYVTLAHGVDATNLKGSATDSIYAFCDKFDRVIWNFPCVRAPAGFDGQVDNLEENKSLLSGFFCNVSAYLRAEGEVHVTHKTLEPFQWWDVVGLAQREGLRHCRSVVFDRVGYPGYTNRKVLDNKSFPAHDAVTYVFSPSPHCSMSGPGDQRDGLVRYADIRGEVSELLRHYARAQAGGGSGGGAKKRKRYI